jgi:Na+-transporting NADH:ubiquinone oxidoreductase subunit NqrC
MSIDLSNFSVAGLEAKIIAILVLLAVVAGGAYWFHERGVKIDALNKEIVEKDKTIKDLKHVVDTDKKVEGITEDTNVKIANDTTDANAKHAAIDDKTDKAIAEIERKFKIKAEKDKALAAQVAADATARDTAISVALISSVWEQYCSGVSGKSACSAQ